MGAMDFVKIHRDETLSVAHDTVTPVPFTSATHDPQGYWDDDTKLVIPTGKGGVPFLVWGNVFLDEHPSPDGNIAIYKNGSSIDHDGLETFIKSTEQADGFGLGWISTPPVVHVFEDGDELTFVLWQDSGEGGNASVDFKFATLSLLRLTID